VYLHVILKKYTKRDGAKGPDACSEREKTASRVIPTHIKPNTQCESTHDEQSNIANSVKMELMRSHTYLFIFGREDGPNMRVLVEMNKAYVFRVGNKDSNGKNNMKKQTFLSLA